MLRSFVIDTNPPKNRILPRDIGDKWSGSSTMTLGTLVWPDDVTTFLLLHDAAVLAAVLGHYTLAAASSRARVECDGCIATRDCLDANVGRTPGLSKIFGARNLSYISARARFRGRRLKHPRGQELLGLTEYQHEEDEFDRDESDRDDESDRWSWGNVRLGLSQSLENLETPETPNGPGTVQIASNQTGQTPKSSSPKKWLDWQRSSTKRPEYLIVEDVLVEVVTPSKKKKRRV
ncbi:hypothetical protein BKA63DRAFT_576253 [Paraphoma chrysanthemicola]|nr:hypothetical protein BKA63DRAFT_576253 [Paraphoma chrysanthemicola]